MYKQGEVYIPVEAAETLPMFLSAGGSGHADTGIITVIWNSHGGVTGNYGWPSKMPLIGINDTVEDINNKLVQGINMTYPTKEEKFRYLLELGSCAY